MELLRRVTGLWCVALLVALFAGPGPAHAWSNGSRGCNSFGTHDWTLKKGIRAAGQRASWVAGTRRAARDRRPRLQGRYRPRLWDLVARYDRWGDEWGGADEATAVWFRRVMNRLANGNERGASRALGIMSHFVADVANPMPTDSSEREDGVHSSYESAVDLRIYDRYSFNYNGEDSARPGPKTRLWRVSPIPTTGTLYVPTTITATTARSTGLRSAN